MKKFLAFLLAAVMATALLAGCGEQKGGTVATDGSTSMEKVINALGESFMQNNSGTTFTYNPTGSGSGIQAVSEGRCDIGLASRSLKDDEKAGGLQETVLAYDGIAIIVSPENPVSDLSVEQIAKIYTGEITNWKDVGGNDADIVLIGREAGSGTRDGFESITDTKDKCQYRQELTSTGDVITAVSQNPNAIGYASLSAVKDSVKALTVGGSLTQTFGLVNPGDATLSFDYFRTQFYNSVVADQEMYADRIVFYDTDGRSYTDTYQIDFSWSPVERLDIFATFRYTDSEMTIRRADGGTARVERPLVSQYKTLLNIQYATKFRRWVFDATAQLNGPARIPTQTGDLDDSYYSPRYPMFFAQVSRKVGKFDIYAGCENIADYRQKDPILNAQDPYDYKFNSMNVWGPLMGRKFYVGLRFNLY